MCVCIIYVYIYKNNSPYLVDLIYFLSTYLKVYKVLDVIVQLGYIFIFSLEKRNELFFPVKSKEMRFIFKISDIINIFVFLRF